MTRLVYWTFGLTEVLSALPSTIHRYPNLIVHRMLRKYCFQQKMTT